MKVQILDTTLREGEQTPGVSFKISQKIKIVKLLNRFGIDFIEVGHPVVSRDIYSFINRVSKLKINSNYQINLNIWLFLNILRKINLILFIY